MVNALGIAASYSGGLIEFSRCQEGAMIKRLHLGKAGEGGVTAALLASRGFAGPESILEGKFGFCQTYSDSPEACLSHPPPGARIREHEYLHQALRLPHQRARADRSAAEHCEPRSVSSPKRFVKSSSAASKSW